MNLQKMSTTNNDNRRIIIVGASSGLGKALAESYAGSGCRLGVCARRVQPLKELAADFPGIVMYRELDVTAEESREQFRRLIDELGGVDIVIFAAGCGWNNPMLNNADDDRTVATNTVGFTRIINEAFRWFAENRTASDAPGQICAITSIAGTKGLGVSTTYSATKRYQNTYLEALTQLSAIRGVNVRITDIRPGFIDTPLLDTSAHRYPMLMSVEYAAKRIRSAIDRRRKVAYIDWRWHAVVFLWRLIPRCLWVRLRINL